MLLPCRETRPVAVDGSSVAADFSNMDLLVIERLAILAKLVKVIPRNAETLLNKAAVKAMAKILGKIGIKQGCYGTLT